MRNLRWDPERRPPQSGRNPYLQAAVINAGLGVVVILLALATGGSVLRALVAVAIAWAVGTAYACWRLRRRATRNGD